MKSRIIISLKLLLLLAAFYSVMGTAKAQDIHFTQFYSSPLTMNPSTAGALHDIQALINYRSQWVGVAPYNTFAASFDMSFKKQNYKTGFWAGGINFFSDRAGDGNMGTIQANLTAAYHIRINSYQTLGAGLQGGFAQRSVNFDSFEWGNQYGGNAYDPNLPSGEPSGKRSLSYFDAGAGLLWAYNNTSGKLNVTGNHFKKVNAGFAVYHVTQPKYSFSGSGEKLKLKYVVHGNASLSISNSRWAVLPGFLYNKQGPLHEILAGSMFRAHLKDFSKVTGFERGSAISIGAFYRYKDAVALALQFEYSRYLIRISYDVNTSKLRAATGMRGGFEISLSFVNSTNYLWKAFFKY